jgi:hypothetical protein
VTSEAKEQLVVGEVESHPAGKENLIKLEVSVVEILDRVISPLPMMK